MACRFCSRADTLPATTPSICSLPVTRLASSQRHLSTALRPTVRAALTLRRLPLVSPQAYHSKTQSAGRNALQHFLKMALGIDVHWLLRELLEIGARLRENERSRGIKTTIEIDGADESFKRIRQSRC